LSGKISGLTAEIDELMKAMEEWLVVDYVVKAVVVLAYMLLYLIPTH